jgi:WD40 repeat protein
VLGRDRYMVRMCAGIRKGRCAAGGADDGVMHWLVGEDIAIDERRDVHGGSVNCLAWHPVGHLLCSVGSDASLKFWTRRPPGDVLLGHLQTTTLGPHQSTQIDPPPQVWPPVRICPPSAMESACLGCPIHLIVCCTWR